MSKIKLGVGRFGFSGGFSLLISSLCLLTWPFSAHTWFVSLLLIGTSSYNLIELRLHFYDLV